jgi:GTP cyclohydrolase IA
LSRDVDRAARAIEEFLRAVGAPVDSDPELAQTGRRVAEAFAEDLLDGYRQDPGAILSESTASDASGLVVIAQIATATICPHHLMPATGVVHVAYLPGDRVVGFGALARLVDCYAHRLMLQEDLGRSIARALETHLEARGAAAIVDLAPTCLTARGSRRHGARAITSAYAGEIASSLELQRQVADAIRSFGVEE